MLLDVLDLGAIANPMFKMKGPSMIQGSYPPAFPLKHQQKDMRLALALGDENSVAMPVAAAANEAFKKVRSMGLGDLTSLLCTRPLLQAKARHDSTM
ncbi:putative oxidoreductase glyr1 [Orobanche hederae]